MPASSDPHDETPFLPEEWLDLVDESPAAETSAAEPSADANSASGERASVGGPEERLRRARLHARALRSLPRIATPAELDGLVVAALHGGHREDRAAAYVASLGALPVPPSLEPRVEHEVAATRDPAATGAPAALDRLVEMRVLAESAIGGARVPGSSVGADRRLRLSQRVSGLVSATGAGVVLGVLLGVVGVMWSLDGGGVGSTSAEGATESFVEFIEVDVRDLSPSERALIERMGGPLMGGRS